MLSDMMYILFIISLIRLKLLKVLDGKRKKVPERVQISQLDVTCPKRASFDPCTILSAV